MIKNFVNFNGHLSPSAVTNTTYTVHDKVQFPLKQLFAENFSIVIMLKLYFLPSNLCRVFSGKRKTWQINDQIWGVIAIIAENLLWE